jgi:acyl carrier protein
MNNLEKYDATFVDTLMVGRDALAALKYQDVEAWDSVGHMQLMNALEEAFGIEMDIDDIIAFSGHEAGKGILAKYGVQL